MRTRRSYPVPEGLVGERADVALSRLLGISRTKAANLLDRESVTLAGQPLDKATLLSDGELEVDLTEIPVRTATPEIPGSLATVFEDLDLIIIDKPIGVAAHPSPGWVGPTVTGVLASSGRTLSSLGASERQGIVHRLDVGTSGLMVVAKSDLAYRYLKLAFKERTVEKTYHALVQGHLDPTSGTIDAPIGRHPTADYRFAVTSDGRPSVTHYDVLEMMPSASLLSIRLETGRTHQIRVHMSAIRHPLVGDATYGADPSLAARVGLSRQWLHAMGLAFTHPTTGKRIEVSSTYPSDLTRALEILREEDSR